MVWIYFNTGGLGRFIAIIAVSFLIGRMRILSGNLWEDQNGKKLLVARRKGLYLRMYANNYSPIIYLDKPTGELTAELNTEE